MTRTLGAVVGLLADVLATPITIVTRHYQRIHRLDKLYIQGNKNIFQSMSFAFYALYLKVGSREVRGDEGRERIRRYTSKVTSRILRIIHTLSQGCTLYDVTIAGSVQTSFSLPSEGFNETYCTSELLK